MEYPGPRTHGHSDRGSRTLDILARLWLQVCPLSYGEEFLKGSFLLSNLRLTLGKSLLLKWAKKNQMNVIKRKQHSFPLLGKAGKELKSLWKSKLSTF